MLRVTYELADLSEPGVVVELRETRGTVRVLVERTARLEDFVATMNPVCEELLAGGQWFQLWKGEVVTLDSPSDLKQGGTVARLHRGSLVQEGTTGPKRSEEEAHTG